MIDRLWRTDNDYFANESADVASVLASRVGTGPAHTTLLSLLHLIDRTKENRPAALARIGAALVARLSAADAEAVISPLLQQIGQTRGEEQLDAFGSIVRPLVPSLPDTADWDAYEAARHRPHQS